MMRPLEDIEDDIKHHGAAYVCLRDDGRYEVWGYEADDDLRDLIARVRELEGAIEVKCAICNAEAPDSDCPTDCPLYPYRKET
jgi:hypothetical protein